MAIAFREHEMRGLIDGSRTQMRRVLRPRPLRGYTVKDVVGSTVSWVSTAYPDMVIERKHQGLGIPGDVHQVKEAYYETLNGEDEMVFVGYVAGGEGEVPEGADFTYLFTKKQKLSGSHMPLRLSRFSVTLTEVRVQRLQDITEEDAEAEGHSGVPPIDSAVDDFRDTWDRLARVDDRWVFNPWIRALSFSVEKTK